ncbi:MAG TPA: hypothetical protein VFX33_09145 [Actinomycetales bacterium]|nr:hypothetical protein [Actinomycetales bacterium]
MFVQVIQGRTQHPHELRDTLDDWAVNLASGAEGWLGSTAGVTDDGRVVALARFESEELARRNSERPEQGEWWSRAAELLEGEATFRDSSDVTVDVLGNPDEAGFVQVMQGRTRDPQRALELMTTDATDWSAYRPDVIGSITIGHGDGYYTTAIYFTSEAEAREGEQKEPPPELKQQMDEFDELSLGEPEFFDLKEPWLYWPR